MDDTLQLCQLTQCSVHRSSETPQQAECAAYTICYITKELMQMLYYDIQSRLLHTCLAQRALMQLWLMSDVVVLLQNYSFAACEGVLQA